MARYELVVPSEVSRIRALHDAGKRLQEICRLSRRSRWTVRRILANLHPACTLRANNNTASGRMGRALAPVSSQKENSIAPANQVGSNSKVGIMIVTRSIVEEKFFNRLVVHFSLGRRPKEKFLSDLVSALIVDRVTPSVLEQAAEKVIANHDGRFPAVALCRQYCGEASESSRNALADNFADRSEAPA